MNLKHEMKDHHQFKMRNDMIQSKQEILNDYYTACLSRELSRAGRKEVHLGRGSFGIFGDGKELPQIIMSKFFKNGDWRAGYYRDQTFMLASGLLSPEEFFAQLYGDTDPEHNPSSGGRCMNNHFSTPNMDPNGNGIDLTNRKNSSSDISPTAGQLPRALGLAYASKLYRHLDGLKGHTKFSKNGNEIVFATVGDASTSEGHFFETLNAAGVLQVPLALSVWDDGWGISVPKELQTIKQNISAVVSGMLKDEDSNGIQIFKCNGWDYVGLYEIYKKGLDLCRNEHVPVLFHIDQLSQPFGHSTSGSHERYKPANRIAWEKEFDCNKKFKEWIIQNTIANITELEELEKKAKQRVKLAKERAWNEYIAPLENERQDILNIIESKTCACTPVKQLKIADYERSLKKMKIPTRKEMFSSSKKLLRQVCSSCPNGDNLKVKLSSKLNSIYIRKRQNYNHFLYNESLHSVLNVEPVQPKYPLQPEMVDARIILRDNFDALFKKYPELVTFGEDTGKLGGVNQTMEGMQEKYGELRITDTGIRENTIIGQAIGLALRGMRPIAEIQYLDYLLYGLQTLSDDLATTHYRTRGIQKAPAIIRTRGHRFEGIWHSGSPLGLIISASRGMYICVPRNATQAAGIYNTLLEGDDPALVVEPLRAYRRKEIKPTNPGEYMVPLGVPEVIAEGDDITVVTYGSCVKIAHDVVTQLKDFNIHCELIDAQTLLPFDIHHTIGKSVKKTNRIIFMDEDVPGGATGFMMQQVLEVQNAYLYLDSKPVTLSAQEHRPAYTADGDYFSNPNAEDLFEAIYNIMNESAPLKYPKLY